MTYHGICNIIKTVKKAVYLNEYRASGERRKHERRNETSELLKEVAEENQTRKILEILNESKDLAEAKEKVKALLNK